MISQVAKFADDTQVIRMVKIPTDCQELQKELSDLGVTINSSPKKKKKSVLCRAVKYIVKLNVEIIRKGV